ncbi:MAG: hypothetical protein Q8J60_03260, partial [Thiobacillus sp.]|nr:hypothetical protein [Thiobacillus sp.]
LNGKGVRHKAESEAFLRFSPDLLLSGNTFFLLQKKFSRLWFSFADLLESARRLDHKSRTDLWCGF